MEITVNTQPYSIDDNCTLSALVHNVLQISESGIAIAVNQAIITKANWSSHFLQPGDQMLLIKATQGG